MDHEKTIGYLRKNAVVTAEACDMIGMSKQRVSKLKDDGELVPVKQNRGGQTYYRGDILKYKLDKKNKEKMTSLAFNRACAICTAEDPCMSIQFYEENVHLLYSIKGVYFYFDAVDAVVDGYYALDSVDSENGLYSLYEPSCVLEDQNGQQMWLRGLSCGYIGP